MGFISFQKSMIHKMVGLHSLGCAVFTTLVVNNDFTCLYPQLLASSQDAKVRCSPTKPRPPNFRS